MCRLIGFASPTETTLSALIGEGQCSTFQHLSRLHDDGWGTMWLDDGNRLTSLKAATPGQDDPRLTKALTQKAARAGVTHLRMATDGMAVREQNSHPFIAGGIGLAHNGSIVPTGILRDRLPAEVLSEVHGDTDSELYLALIRSGVREGMPLGEASHWAADWLRRVYPRASLNALVLSASEFVVVHASSLSEPPYDDFLASGLRHDELPLGHTEAYYELSYLQREDGAVAVASTGIDRSGWTPVPDESVLTVDLESFEITTMPLDGGVRESVA
jgi:glutamine amidotransferase